MVFEDCCLSVMVFFISNKFRTPARWSCLKEIMSELALDLINLQMELGCREVRWLVGLAAPPPCSPPFLSLPFLHQPALSLPMSWEECGAEKSESRSRLFSPSATAGTSEGAPAEHLAVQTPLMPTRLPPPRMYNPGTNLSAIPKAAIMIPEFKHSLGGDETTS